jgi:outer membrane protein OmpA-like peptidoglycan-associated protein
MLRRLVLVVAACATALIIREVRSDACGVKLNIKAPRVRKQADRSANPRQILLLGDPPRSLSKELTARGHRVEVASNADEARRVKYHVIVADPEREDEAKTRWPGSIVVVRHGNARADANVVEEQIGASPIATGGGQGDVVRTAGREPPVRTGPPRPEERTGPVAAGGGAAESGEGRAVTASGGGSEAVAASAPASAPAAAPAASDETEQPEPRPSKRVATRDETPAAAEVASVRAPSHFTKRIFFGNSSSDLNDQARAKLLKNAQWLKRHADRSVLVEGHASTTGAPEANQALSDARARVVKEFLVENGVEDSRVTAQGMGSSQPEFKPGTSRKNRRVVIKLQ